MGIVRCRLHPQEVTFNTNWTCSWGLDTPTLCVILSGGSESCCVARKCQCLGSLHLSVVPNYLHYFNWTTECRHQIIGKKQLYLLHNEVGLCKQYMPDVWSRIEAKRSILESFQTSWYRICLSNSSCQTGCVLYSEYSHPCWDDTVKLLAHWFVAALQVKRSSIADYVILCTCVVECVVQCVWTHLSCCKLC